MALSTDKKRQIFADFGKHAQDTGSTEVQIAHLTAEIQDLKGHFEANPKDFSSQRGLMAKINARRKFLSYLSKTDKDSYTKLIQRLGIRK